MLVIPTRGLNSMMRTPLGKDGAITDTAGRDTLEAVDFGYLLAYSHQMQLTYMFGSMN
jgi:hypothetical protein